MYVNAFLTSYSLYDVVQGILYPVSRLILRHKMVSLPICDTNGTLCRCFRMQPSVRAFTT